MKKVIMFLGLAMMLAVMTSGFGFSQVNFDKLGYIPETGHTFVGWYDLDNNGIKELTFRLNDVSVSRSYEYVPLSSSGISRNPFRLVAEYPHGVKAVGDTDNDNKGEIIYQSGDHIGISESHATSVFPDTSVWYDDLRTCISIRAGITDLNRNHLKEIVITGNALESDPGLHGQFAMYENTLGNNYNCVFNSSWLSLFDKEWVGPFAVGDFDGDGEKEIALSSIEGEIGIVFYIGSGYYWGDVVYDLPILNCYQMTALNDVNNNGRDEFVVGGWDNVNGGWYYAMMEYNPTTASYFILHDWHFTSSSYACAAGDTDGDGRDELAIGSGNNIYLYEFNPFMLAPHLIYTFQGSSAPGIGIYAYFYDIDSDGDEEILFDNRNINQMEIYKRNDITSSSLEPADDNVTK